MERIINCVMLIDDHRPTNVLHKMIIENTGLVKQVLIFESGVDALSYLQNSLLDNKPVPDLIFLDINMPEMDGWEFLEAYKAADNEFKTETLLLMLSTSTHPDDLKKAKKESIVTDYIYKPLTEEFMIKVAEKFFLPK